MQLNFRQGLVTYQRDQTGAPTYLQASQTNPSNISLMVSPTAFAVTFAHGASDYLATFDSTVDAAWGPLKEGSDNYLYVDMDLLTSKITFGHTNLIPIIGAGMVAPELPDQHWFDHSVNKMKVFQQRSGTWLEKIRVIVGRAINPHNITPMTFGSSVGLNVPGKPGYPMLDSMLRPLRTSTGELLTTLTDIRVKNTVGTSGVLATPTNAFIPVQAGENIPAMSLVHFTAPDTVSLASSDPALTVRRTPVGLVRTSLVTNEIGIIYQYGDISYDQWDWSAHIGKALYCDNFGGFTVQRPAGLLAYRVGVVKNKNTIILGIDAETEAQVYQAGPSQFVLSAQAPLTSTDVINSNGERVISVGIQASSTTQDGSMTKEQAGRLAQNTQLIADNIVAIDGLRITKADKTHSHVVSDVTGLQAVLDGKANTVHTHVIADTTGLQAALDGKALKVHTHMIADVSNLQTTLTNLQTSIDDRALKIHTHVAANIIDLQTLLDEKSNTDHTHVIADTTGLQTALDGKAALVHTHVIGDVTGLRAELDALAGGSGTAGMVWKKEYNDTTTYAAKDVVRFQSGLYTCIQAGVGHQPNEMESQYWEWMVGESGSGGGLFWGGEWSSDPGEYAFNAIVSHRDALYVKLDDSVNNDAPTSEGGWDHWMMMIDNIGMVWSGDWLSITMYRRNNVVKYEGNLYIKRDDAYSPNKPSEDSDAWTQLTESGGLKGWLENIGTSIDVEGAAIWSAHRDYAMFETVTNVDTPQSSGVFSTGTDMFFKPSGNASISFGPCNIITELGARGPRGFEVNLNRYVNYSANTSYTADTPNGRGFFLGGGGNNITIVGSLIDTETYSKSDARHESVFGSTIIGGFGNTINSQNSIVIHSEDVTLRATTANERTMRNLVAGSQSIDLRVTGATILGSIGVETDDSLGVNETIIGVENARITGNDVHVIGAHRIDLSGNSGETFQNVIIGGNNNLAWGCSNLAMINASGSHVIETTDPMTIIGGSTTRPNPPDGTAGTFNYSTVYENGTGGIQVRRVNGTLKKASPDNSSYHDNKFAIVFSSDNKPELLPAIYKVELDINYMDAQATAPVNVQEMKNMTRLYKMEAWIMHADITTGGVAGVNFGFVEPPKFLEHFIYENGVRVNDPDPLDRFDIELVAVGDNLHMTVRLKDKAEVVWMVNFSATITETYAARSPNGMTAQSVVFRGG